MTTARHAIPASRQEQRSHALRTVARLMREQGLTLDDVRAATQPPPVPRDGEWEHHYPETLDLPS